VASPTETLRDRLLTKRPEAGSREANFAVTISEESGSLRKFCDCMGTHRYWDENNNPAYKLFLG
jgi:hypothetical protein